MGSPPCPPHTTDYQLCRQSLGIAHVRSTKTSATQHAHGSLSKETRLRLAHEDPRGAELRPKASANVNPFDQPSLAAQFLNFSWARGASRRRWLGRGPPPKTTPAPGLGKVDSYVAQILRAGVTQMLVFVSRKRRGHFGYMLLSRGHIG